MSDDVIRIDESAAGLRRSLDEAYRRLDRTVDERDAAIAETAAAEQRGYDKAVAKLRVRDILDRYGAWGEADGRVDDGTFLILDARDFASVADYLEAVRDQP